MLSDLQMQSPNKCHASQNVNISWNTVIFCYSGVIFMFSKEKNGKKKKENGVCGQESVD